MNAAGSVAQFRAPVRNLSQGVGGLLAALLTCALASGCAEPETVELVAIRGCGLEQEFSGLRVRVLGDLPASGGSEVLLGPGERGSIPELPEDASGIAAEGLFGTTVTAIGRSWGVDPELAAGRVPGLDSEAATLPVYFAAPDSLCPIEQPATLGPRTEAAGAVGPAGDVLLAGGVDEQGALLDELVHLDLFADRVRALAVRLPSPRRGASVHALGGRRFAVLGGAAAGSVTGEWLEVDVRGQGSVRAEAEIELDHAHHAHARSVLDGRVLIAGGCGSVDEAGSCEPASATADSAWLDLEARQAEALPALATRRYGAHARVSSDGVAFVAGGFDSDGLGLPSLERLEPDGAWDTVHSLADAQAIAGLTLLDGGLVLLSDRDGGLHWWSEAGSGSLDPTLRAPPLEPVGGERPLLTLPGERVLVDAWLFAPASAAVDPAAERVLLDPAVRSGATALELGDGTVLLAGGRPPTSPTELAEPTLLRLRPELDGPDEWIPDLAGPQTDAFVCNAPGQATVSLGGLRVDADGGPAEVLAPIRAHVRGFRSRSFRLELEFEHDPGATAQLVLGQGAATLVAVALLPEGVVVRRRDAGGVVEQLDCGQGGVQPGAALVLEIDDEGRALRLSSDVPIAECELDWPSSAGLIVGFGASGTGAASFFDLRLARR